MKNYVYKILVASIAFILVYQFTIGKELKQINQKINLFSSKDGRKKIVNSLKKEMKKATEKESYFKEEEKILIKNFIKKVQKELELKN